MGLMDENVRKEFRMGVAGPKLYIRAQLQASRKQWRQKRALEAAEKRAFEGYGL